MSKINYLTFAFDNAVHWYYHPIQGFKRNLIDVPIDINSYSNLDRDSIYSFFCNVQGPNLRAVTNCKLRAKIIGSHYPIRASVVNKMCVVRSTAR